MQRPRIAGFLCKAGVCAIVAFSFCPTITGLAKHGNGIATPFGTASAKLAESYADSDAHIYSSSEIAFVNEVLSTIPENALVINSPGDGSMWAYGTQGLNTYYRFISFDNIRPEACTIKDRLCDYASDKEVQDAVHSTGAQYVLLLDKDVSHEDGIWLSQFDKHRYNECKGIDSVDDDTPGFEVLLAEGDEMRLYRIVE